MLTAICDKCGKEEKLKEEFAFSKWYGPLHIVKPVRRIGNHLCPDCGKKMKELFAINKDNWERNQAIKDFFKDVFIKI